MVQTTGNVQTVSNSDGTLTISPTSGQVIASLATPIAFGSLPAGQYANVNSATDNSTTSATEVMAGYGLAFTPSKTGKVIILVKAVVYNATAGDGLDIPGFRYGTGTAPTNGAAATGTNIFKQILRYTAIPTGSNNEPLGFGVYVTGLTLNTAYWFDLSFNVVTGGTAHILWVDAFFIEATP